MSKRPCEFPQCGRPLRSLQGLCGSHRTQQLLGKPLTPLRPPGYCIRGEWEPTKDNWESATGRNILHKISSRAETASNGCRIWTGRLTEDGYAAITVKGKMRKVSRLVLSRKLGRPVLPELCACHDCPGGDNKRCINPDHLWEGTHAQNGLDWRNKNGGVEGTKNANARLSDDDVVAIRASVASNTVLAGRHGVSRTAIRKIRQGLAWRHIPMGQP